MAVHGAFRVHGGGRGELTRCHECHGDGEHASAAQAIPQPTRQWHGDGKEEAERQHGEDGPLHRLAEVGCDVAERDVDDVVGHRPDDGGGK